MIARDPATAAVTLLSVALLLGYALTALYNKLALSTLARRAASYIPPARLTLSGKTILVLVNPHGGSRQAAVIFESVVAVMCKKAGVKIDLVQTERAGHAREISKAMSPNRYAAIVCVSGDGMLHEVLNGLADDKTWSILHQRSEDIPAKLGCVPVCIIPAGTSNGVATNMVSSDPVKATQYLIEGSPHPVDLVCTRFASGRPAVWDMHVVSWAMVAEHDALVEKKIRWMGKTLKEVYAPVHVIARARPHAARCYLRPTVGLRTAQSGLTGTAGLPSATPTERQYSGRRAGEEPDGSEWRLLQDDRFLVLSAANMAHASHDVVFAPHVRPDDGALHLLIVRGASRCGLAKVFLALGSGSHVNMAETEIYSASEFVLEPQRGDSCPLDISGESYLPETVHVKCHRRAGLFWTTPAAIAAGQKAALGRQ